MVRTTFRVLLHLNHGHLQNKLSYVFWLKIVVTYKPRVYTSSVISYIDSVNIGLYLDCGDTTVLFPKLEKFPISPTEYQKYN